MGNYRFTAIKRTALDGRTWWVVWDSKYKKYSTLCYFGKYPTKKACQIAIKIFCKGSDKS